MAKGSSVGSGLKVKVIPGAEIKAAVDALRKVDKKLPGQFRKLIQRIAQPIMKDQRRAVKSMPVKGPRTTGLRKEIGRGVRLTKRVSRVPTIRINTFIQRDEGGILPRGLDTFFGDFRGGPKDHWHWQHGYGAPWFMGPAAAQQRNMEQELTKLLRMSAEEIRRAAARAVKRGRPKGSLTD